MAIGGIQFLVRSYTEGSGPYWLLTGGCSLILDEWTLHRAAPNTVAQLIHVRHPRKAWKRRWASQKSQSFLIHSHKDTSSHLPSSVHGEQDNRSSQTQGRQLHKCVCINRWGITENLSGSLLTQRSRKKDYSKCLNYRNWVSRALKSRFGTHHFGDGREKDRGDSGGKEVNESLFSTWRAWG